MDLKKKNIRLDIINDARVILFGIAAFLVVFFHTSKLDYMEIINIPILSNLMCFVQKIGNCGVDIFLFLSGIGLYYSLSKNSILKFYKNRLVKIMPIYLIVLIIYSFFVVEMRYHNNIIKSLFGLPFYLDGVRDGWYIAFIMPMYLIFPLIYKIMKKYDIYALFVMLFISVLCNLSLSLVLPIYYFKWEVAICRVPIFLIGTFVGKKMYNGEKISLEIVRNSFIIMIVSLVILYFNIDVTNLAVFTRYFYCFVVVGFVLSVSWLYSLCKKKESFLLKIIKFMGVYSLEMYLINEKCTYILRNIFLLTSYVEIYLLSFIITLVLSFILNKIIGYVISIISLLFKKIKLI